MLLTYQVKNEREIAKPIFSDRRPPKTLDIVITSENGKNKCSRKANVNITKLT